MKKTPFKLEGTEEVVIVSTANPAGTPKKEGDKVIGPPYKSIAVHPISTGDANWLSSKRITSFMDAEVIVFPGGGDVSPLLYNEPVGKWTYFSASTDTHQISIFKNALKQGKAMIGICRGLQLLHVMAGGKLVQDVQHSNMHRLNTYDGELLVTNSLHHQQVMFDGMKEGIDYVLLAWASTPSPYHLAGNNQDYNFGKDYKDPEVVYYPKINAIGIQGHPEFTNMPEETRDWFEKQVYKYLNL